MKLTSKLPEGDSNGLNVAGPAMVAKPRQVHVVLALVDCSKVEEDTDTGAREPTARIRRIEVLLEKDKKQAEKLLRRALDRRLGKTQLPLELEDELTQLFDEITDLEIDPETGEVKPTEEPDSESNPDAE